MTKKHQNTNKKPSVKQTLVIAIVTLAVVISAGVAVALLRNTSAASQQDLNNDFVIDTLDLSILLSKWGQVNAGNADITADGIVNVFDLSSLLGAWGVVASSKPDASNTGVPSGISLRSITAAYPDPVSQGYSIDARGKVVITKDGGVYDRLLITDGVLIKAKNITIRNSRIEGGKSSLAASLPREPSSWEDCRALRAELDAQSKSPPTVNVVDTVNGLVENFLLEDSEIVVTESSVYMNSFMGHDSTLRRVDISGGVDGVGVYKGTASYANVLIEDSWIHDLYWGQWSVGNYNLDPVTQTRMYCGYDAAHPEGTHNDGIQTHGGNNITIRRNTISVKPWNHDQANAGIMVNIGGNLAIESNHFQYGVCSINIVTGIVLPVNILNNTFYGNNGFNGTGVQGDGNCAIIRPSAAGYTFTNNLWHNGKIVKLTNG